MPIITMNDCAMFVADGWNEVTPATIRHCWMHAGIVPGAYVEELNALDTEDSTESDMDQLSSDLHSLLSLPAKDLELTQIQSENVCKADEYVNIDDDQVSHAVLRMFCILIDNP
jgi:hypothetical protein